ncbi:hypothetical protein HanRHA438_Chr16g0760001 [Helianthus annuus]|nr:hypothetical protein HanRHA438_Chr16g0760001 [Helianthus annuus]
MHSRPESAPCIFFTNSSKTITFIKLKNNHMKLSTRMATSNANRGRKTICKLTGGGLETAQIK